MDDVIVSVEGLTRTYDSQGGVADLSFRIGPGEVVGLLGPNGAGKSTTLHCLAGIVAATSGTILFDGHPHDEPAAKDAFGFLPDDLPLPESLRLAEVLSLHRRLRPRYDDGLACDLLELVGLTRHAAKYVGEYSHGMKRKLQLVTALAHRPRFLMLDEPMRGLDPEAAVLVRMLIDSFATAGGAVLVATHDLAAAEKQCHQVVVLAAGKVVATGSPAELIRSAGASGLEEYFIRATGLEAGIDAVRSMIHELDFFAFTGTRDGVRIHERC